MHAAQDIVLLKMLDISIMNHSIILQLLLQFPSAISVNLVLWLKWLLYSATQILLSTGQMQLLDLPHAVAL